MPDLIKDNGALCLINFLAINKIPFSRTFSNPDAESAERVPVVQRLLFFPLLSTNSKDFNQ
ncbi:hypothetical protein [Rickettsiella endosymbiont of Xylota segnis]|uniref:hypothetical protein n=1 Tax=Rickettsiella endosymbiont of Xylota segnis TaxID=3066238 RepID=UPI0030CB905A